MSCGAVVAEASRLSNYDGFAGSEPGCVLFQALESGSEKRGSLSNWCHGGHGVNRTEMVIGGDSIC